MSVKMDKGRSSAKKNRKYLLAIIQYAHYALPPNTQKGFGRSDRSVFPYCLFTLRR